jgi:signal transduction histidine kinase
MVVNKQTIGCVVLLQDTTEEQLLERSRDEFFSIASHELRTPLTSIRGNSSMILDHYGKDIHSDDLREMLYDIHESSERLIGIVNDFLDVSRLEQGRIGYHMQEVELGGVVRAVTNSMKGLLETTGLSLELGSGLQDKAALPIVLADAARLKQILINLIGNSIKFTEHGGITITARASGGEVMVEVHDTGVGISPKQRSLLFHKFQQASDSILTRDAAHGTGLGLYISRLLAQGMGGSLVLAKSDPGKGSTFVLKLLASTPSRLKRLAKDGRVLDSKSGLLVEHH